MGLSVIVKGPKFRTAKQLVADGTFPVSQATLLKLAKEHGIGRMMGRTIVFSAEDVTCLYEALPTWHSQSSVAPKAPTGSSVAPSGASALKKLQGLLTKKPPKPSASKGKTNS